MIEEALAIATDALDLFPQETVLIDEPPDGRGTLDLNTGAVTFPAGDRIYSGSGRRTIRQAGRSDGEGGGSALVDECVVTLRELPPGIRVGQLVSFPDSGEVQVWEVVRAAESTMGLGRKIVCERRTGAWTTAGPAA